MIIRALLQRPTRQGPPIQSPAEFADALAAVAPPAPLPEPRPRRRPGYQGHGGYGGYGGYGPDPNNPDTWRRHRGQAAPPPTSAQPSSQFPRRARGMQYTGHAVPGRYQGGQRRGTSRACSSVVVVLVLVVIAVLVWVVGFRKSGTPTREQRLVVLDVGTPPRRQHGTHARGGQHLQHLRHPARQHRGPDDRRRPPSTAAPSTAWYTSYYFNHAELRRPEAGHRPADRHGQGRAAQPGRGAVRRERHDHGVGLPGQRPGDDEAAARWATSRLVSPSVSAHRRSHRSRSRSQATGRYVLIWLTSLPQLPNPPPGQAREQHVLRGPDLQRRGAGGSAAAGNSCTRPGAADVGSGSRRAIRRRLAPTACRRGPRRVRPAVPAA